MTWSDQLDEVKHSGDGVNSFSYLERSELICQDEQSSFDTNRDTLSCHWPLPLCRDRRGSVCFLFLHILCKCVYICLILCARVRVCIGHRVFFGSASESLQGPVGEGRGHTVVSKIKGSGWKSHCLSQNLWMALSAITINRTESAAKIKLPYPVTPPTPLFSHKLIMYCKWIANMYSLKLR